MPVALGVAAAVALGAAVVGAPGAYALVVPALLAVGVLWAVLCWTATGEPGDLVVARWTYLSYFLHLGLSLAIGASGQTVSFFGGDANTYHDDSLAIVRHWSSGTPMPRLPPGKEGFFYALARLYELIGPYRAAGLAVTSLCSALVVPLVADTTRRLFGERPRLRVLPLIVLLPGLLIWTSQLLREAPILAGLALGTNLAVRLSERIQVGRLAALGLTIATLFTLRANIALVFAAGLLVGLVMGGRHLMAGVVTAAAVTGLIGAIVLGGGLGAAGYDLSVNADLGQVNTVRSDLSSSASSGVGKSADVSTTSGSLAYLPIGLPQFLLGPFPWQAHNLRQGLGVLEAMTIWWLVPKAVRGLRRGGRLLGRRAMLVLAPTAIITVVLTLLIGNLGTVVRERLQVTVLLLPMIALGWNRDRAEDDGPETPGGVTPVG